LNVTYYRLLFLPGWQEEYVVGRVVNSSPATAHFERVAESGSGTYSIHLGGQLQLSNSQSSGPSVALPADILWSSVASGRYSVSAWLVYRAGATARQLVNFTTEPMSLLYSASRTCAYKSFSDDFSGACVPVNYSFDATIPNNRTYVSRARFQRLGSALNVSLVRATRPKLSVLGQLPGALLHRLRVALHVQFEFQDLRQPCDLLAEAHSSTPASLNFSLEKVTEVSPIDSSTAMRSSSPRYSIARRSSES